MTEVNHSRSQLVVVGEMVEEWESLEHHVGHLGYELVDGSGDWVASEGMGIEFLADALRMAIDADAALWFPFSQADAKRTSLKRMAIAVEAATLAGIPVVVGPKIEPITSWNAPRVLRERLASSQEVATLARLVVEEVGAELLLHDVIKSLSSADDSGPRNIAADKTSCQGEIRKLSGRGMTDVEICSLVNAVSQTLRGSAIDLMNVRDALGSVKSGPPGAVSPDEPLSNQPEVE